MRLSAKADYALRASLELATGGEAAHVKAETLARVALVAATAVVIRSGLAVMGVAPVEEMR